METRVWINQIEFSDASKVQIGKNDIVVFVGPNNAGKSVSLKEIASNLRANNGLGKVVKDVKIVKEGDKDALVNFLQRFPKRYLQGNSLPNYASLKFDFNEMNATSWWDNANGIHQLADVFANSLNTEARLTAANPPNNIRLTQDPPTHPIHFLQKNDEVEAQFSSYFKQAFGLDLLVHRNAGNQVPLYIGKAPVKQPGQDRLSLTYLTELEKLDLLHEQGDGMRSFVGVLLNAFIGHYRFLFIDEPEAFLHPPQARLLGKMLGKDLPSERQLFLATHSSEFLKGLLESNNPNLKIIRIQREGHINNVSVLNNKEIDSIWSDSLLRHSNVLDGLFHSQVVICESDSDTRFYSAILSRIHERTGTLGPDTLWLHCGGKYRIPVVIKALKQLSVDIKVIVDFDILNDSNPLKTIFQDEGGDWATIENDWKLVKNAIDAKRPGLETLELNQEIESVFDTVSDKIMPTDKITVIQKLLKKASPWSHAKELGKAFIPSGDPTKAYERLVLRCKEVGLFIVEAGELESFVRSVGNHGPKWVNEVLAKDLANDPELESARNFVVEISAARVK